MNNIPVIDLVFLILIVLVAIRGRARGFIDELFTWAGLVLAIWGAVLLHASGAAYIRTKMMENVQFLPEILAFIAIFIIIMLFLKMLKHILKDVIMAAKLGGANKLLGLIFGIVQGLTITALILFLLAIQPLFDPSNILVDSIFAQILLPIIRIPIDRRVEMIITAVFCLPGIFPA